MGVKFDHECSRCHKNVSVKTETAAEAAALEETINSKQQGMEQLQALVEKLRKAGQLPDLFAVANGQVVGHAYLCPDAAETKRSCQRRIGELVVHMNELEERKPRKKKAADPEIVVTE